MTKRLSLHEKRLLIRYRRLLDSYQTAPVKVLISDVAELMYCSPRYARTLLRDMQQLRWINWTPGVGRGAYGVLWCCADAAALRLLTGEGHHEKTENEHVLPDCNERDRPDGDCFSLTVSRPLSKIAPSPSIVWPERQLVQMIHSGLMRFTPDFSPPVADLAHAVGVSADRMTWIFHLRRGLTWHTGEPVKSEQLLNRLLEYKESAILPHLSAVFLKGRALQLRLNRPDALLLHRLAHPACALSHPEDDTNGLGPFRIVSHTVSEMIMQRSPFWHGELAQAAQIKFEVEPEVKPDWSAISVEITESPWASVSSRSITGESGFAFLIFNTVKSTLSSAQQAILRSIIKAHLPDIMNDLTTDDLPEWLSVTKDDCEPGLPELLPDTLDVVYCLTPEATALAEKVRKSLQWRGCTLNLTPRLGSHWLLPEEDWSRFDFAIGFHPLSIHKALYFEEHYRQCGVFRAFWDREDNELCRTFLNKSASSEVTQYNRRIMWAFRQLSRKNIITPLYMQRWSLCVPEEIRDVRVFELGWPDFTSLWIPTKLPESYKTL